ncbi:MAG: hypothetical protein IKU54_05860 [Oscillospiraceae bacterium]|nr:hypothetical protein [Oscillospiraceae bacterium]
MQTKRKIKRYVIALVMLVLSAYTAIFIKDTVDSMTPENSLPIMSVTIGYNPPYVVRAGYTWSFGTKTVRSPYVSATDAALMVTDCSPGENIVINFSAPYQFISLYQANGLASEEFKPIYNYTTPAEEGIYVYKIEAYFDKGDISYYFAVQVKHNNLMS